jgi:hypothetical protein
MVSSTAVDKGYLPDGLRRSAIMNSEHGIRMAWPTLRQLTGRLAPFRYDEF